MSTPPAQSAIAALVFGLAPSQDAQARGTGRANATLNLVHGIPGADDFPVDIYIVNNWRETLEDVTFGSAAALEARAGRVYVAVGLGPNTSTQAFAIGTFPDSFAVVPLVNS